MGDPGDRLQRVGQQYALPAQQLHEALRRPPGIPSHRIAVEEAHEAGQLQLVLGQQSRLQLRPALQVDGLVLLVAVGVMITQLVHQLVHRIVIAGLKVQQRVVHVEEYGLVTHGRSSRILILIYSI